MPDRGQSAGEPDTGAAHAGGRTHAARRRRVPSLSVKLMILTVIFVMATGIAGFVPTIATFRLRFLEDRLATAQAASVLLDRRRGTMCQPVQDELLATVGATAIVLRTGPATAAARRGRHAGLRRRDRRSQPADVAGRDRRRLLDARRLRAAHAARHRPERDGNSLELVISDRPLRAAMLRFGGTILVLSALISIIAAIPIYASLQRLFVRPMRRLSQAMVHFSEDPVDRSRIIVPSGRTDEIGVAEEELAAMQRQLSETLLQKTHLADLGLAVSKVNHDLRNLLASAQLFSDRIAALPDPAVQRFAPKLIATLGRAIDYCQTTLAYGRAREREPSRRLVAALARRARRGRGAGARQPRHHPLRDAHRGYLRDRRRSGPAVPRADQSSAATPCRRWTARPMRPSCAGSPSRRGAKARWRSVRVRDTGPGVPERARANLFQAFQGGVEAGRHRPRSRHRRRDRSRPWRHHPAHRWRRPRRGVRDQPARPPGRLRPTPCRAQAR